MYYVILYVRINFPKEVNSMYFVDRKAIEEKLSLLNEYLNFYKSKNEWTTFTDKLLLERIVHIVIESILDVGNAMIDGFIMRDPGSYEDIIDILLDEKVVSENNAGGLKNVITLRKVVVRDYTKVDHEELDQVFSTNIECLTNFSSSVQEYLKNELGHVTAFKPDEAM